jgi:chromosome segregation ATPase
MVHKSANKILGDLNMSNVEDSPNNYGIHKYESTSSWLDEYDKEVDKMNTQLDREYEASAKRQEEAEAKISQLQDEEEEQRVREEEQLYQEQMRQLEIEKAKTEVELLKKEIEKAKKPEMERRIVPVVEEKKPTLKERVVSLGKKVAGVVGTITGHPEVGIATAVIPEAQTTTEVKQKEELVLA